ncbi:hypothetical protein Emed_001910 [Eimeria media]
MMLSRRLKRGHLPSSPSPAAPPAAAAAGTAAAAAAAGAVSLPDRKRRSIGCTKPHGLGKDCAHHTFEAAPHAAAAAAAAAVAAAVAAAAAAAGDGEGYRTHYERGKYLLEHAARSRETCSTRSNSAVSPLCAASSPAAAAAATAAAADGEEEL